jgi:cytochrome c oxidase subunit 4
VVNTAVSEVDTEHFPEGEGYQHGATDRQYFIIFFILVGLTALEVSTYWWEDWFGESAHKVAVPLLFVLMIIKFFLVALFFMHLKFDSPTLRRIFWFGTILAIAVYVAALSAMNFWEDSGTTRYDDPPPASANPAGGSDAAATPGAGSGGAEAGG